MTKADDFCWDGRLHNFSAAYIWYFRCNVSIVANSVEQDETALRSSLILIYTLLISLFWIYTVWRRSFYIISVANKRLLADNQAPR